MTRPPIVFLSAFAGMFSLTGARAAPDNLAAAGVAPSQVQVIGRAQTLSSADFATVRGEYRLADGGLLVVEGPRHRPVATLNDQAPVRLVALAPDQFATADGAMRLQFNAHRNGNVDAVTITLQNGTH
jgi:hypothetical protein